MHSSATADDAPTLNAGLSVTAPSSDGSAESSARVIGKFQSPFRAGDVINDKYEVIDLIGEGGVGFVIAAKHIELGYRVALKFLKAELLERPDVIERFRFEAAAAASFKGEHVARVFDVGQLGNGLPFMVMEYLEGKDLFELLLTEGPQPVERAVDFILQACEALAEAHASGIVHRDIKPENLFLVQRSAGLHTLKVLDFGISKLALTGSSEVTIVPLHRTTVPLGSPMYMSPEQIRASSEVDGCTDIWSLGCVLYELLVGTPAFQAPSLTQLTVAILESEPPAASSHSRRVPEAIDAIIARCLAKLPSNRYRSVAELALALSPHASERGLISVERCCLILGANAERPFELRTSMHSGERTRHLSSRSAVAVAPKHWRVPRSALAIAVLSLVASVFYLRFVAFASKAVAPAHAKYEARANPAATPLLPPPSETSPPPVREEKAAPSEAKPAPIAPSKKISKRIASKPRPTKPVIEPDPDPGF